MRWWMGLALAGLLALAATLRSLYPTHRDYVHAVTSATQEAVDAGFLLPIDGDAIIAEAERIAIPDYRNAMERSTHGSGDGIGAG
jgi:hypothetical protein